MIYFLLLLTQLTWAVPQQNSHFERPCYSDGEDALTTHLHVTDRQWIFTHVAFEEDSCQKPYLTFEVQYKVRTKMSEIDMTVTEASYTTLTDEVTESLNWISYCGFTDWKTNEKKIVTGMECSDYSAPTLGDVTYSIFEKAEGGNLLYVGAASQEASGKTPEERHQKLEKRPYFLR